VFARADWTQLDKGAFNPGRPVTETSIYEFTGGVNYYVWKYHAKFTIDLNYLPNGVPQDAAGLGYLSSGSNELVLRSQFQLALSRSASPPRSAFILGFEMSPMMCANSAND